MHFDRFRAYGPTLASKSTFIAAEDGSIPRDEDGNILRTKIDEWPVEDVVAEGVADADGKATFDAGDQVVTKVVFYTGPADAEAVCGSIDVGSAGAISVSCPDPE